MISKELLSEVLGVKVVKVYSVNKLNELSYELAGGELKINIHELANNVKEWALTIDRGYTIDSCMKHTKGKARVGWYEKNHIDKHGTYREHQFYSEWFEADNNLEHEAIFEAGQWILESR